MIFLVTAVKMPVHGHLEGRMFEGLCPKRTEYSERFDFTRWLWKTGHFNSKSVTAEVTLLVAVPLFVTLVSVMINILDSEKKSLY